MKEQRDGGHIESAESTNLQTSRVRSGQHGEFNHQIESRFLPSRTSSKANLQTSKICILQSISPWNTALPSISSLKAS